MRSPKSRQSGVTLIVILLILLLIGILATTVSETNLLQVQMANNDELKMSSMQEALAIVDAILDEPSNLPVIGGNLGDKLCRPAASDPDGVCIRKDLSVDASLENDYVDFEVERVSCDINATFTDLGSVSGADDTRVMFLDISVTVDRTDQNRGFTRVIQGYEREFVVDSSVVYNSCS